jgi:hypothetical protein
MEIVLIIHAKAATLSLQLPAIYVILLHPQLDDIDELRGFCNAIVVNLQFAYQIDIVFVLELRLHGCPKRDGALCVEVGGESIQQATFGTQPFADRVVMLLCKSVLSRA